MAKQHAKLPRGYDFDLEPRPRPAALVPRGGDVDWSDLAGGSEQRHPSQGEGTQRRERTQRTQRTPHRPTVERSVAGRTTPLAAENALTRAIVELEATRNQGEVLRRENAALVQRTEELDLQLQGQEDQVRQWVEFSAGLEQELDVASKHGRPRARPEGSGPVVGRSQHGKGEATHPICARLSEDARTVLDSYCSEWEMSQGLVIGHLLLERASYNPATLDLARSFAALMRLRTDGGGTAARPSRVADESHEYWLTGTALDVPDGDDIVLEVSEYLLPEDSRIEVTDRERIRFRKGNAPEFGEDGWEEAKQRLSKLVLGQRVLVASYNHRSNRWYGLIFLLSPNGRVIGELRLIDGMAELDRRSRVENPFRG